MARSRKTTIRRNRRKLGTIIAKRFKGRAGVMLVGRPPDFQLRCEDHHGCIAPAEVTRIHLPGKACLGVYVVCQSDVCWFAAVDLDNKEDRPDTRIKSKVTRVARCLASADVDHRVAYSQSGRGFHVFVFFSEAVPAYVARRFLLGVLEKANVGTHEVFPKQESVPPGGYGSAIRLPLFNKSRFVASILTVPNYRA